MRSKALKRKVFAFNCVYITEGMAASMSEADALRKLDPPYLRSCLIKSQGVRLSACQQHARPHCLHLALFLSSRT